MQQKTNRLFLGTFIGLAVLGSALLLSLPALFSPHDPAQLWLTGTLGGLTLLLAVAVLVMRFRQQRFPERRGPNGQSPRR
ncbi:hypothetical protein [Arthrobacter sp. G119Y2]|uniref:hypothetical protein n=1 Tax=Arthrobacter sp. G119Y2 TaxID=3134965 RepID=UPI00311946E6